jgi:hypothetical protein
MPSEHPLQHWQDASATRRTRLSRYVATITPLRLPRTQQPESLNRFTTSVANNRSGDRMRVGDRNRLGDKKPSSPVKRPHPALCRDKAPDRRDQRQRNLRPAKNLRFVSPKFAPAKMRRDAEKERRWREALSRQASSGLSVREFCRRERLTEPQFYAWRRTIGERDGDSAQAPSFVPAVVSDQPISGSSIAIELIGGHALKLPASISPTWLAELALALQSRDAR